MAKKASSSGPATNGQSPVSNRLREHLMSMATNLYTSRWGYLEAMMDPRRDIDQECGYSDLAVDDPNEYRRLFDQDPIASRVVKLFPMETWGLPPEIYESEDPKAKTPFEEAWQELGASLGGDNWHDDQDCTMIWEILRRVDMLSGIGHYGVLLLGFDDTPNLHEPVEGIDDNGYSQIAKRKKSGRVANATPMRKLLYMRAFDESQVRITRLEDNVRNPRYGQPVLYEIDFNDVNNSTNGQAVVSIGTKAVHWTRVIHVTDNVMSNEFVGVPRCKPVLRRIVDLRKLYGGSAEMFWKGAFPGLSIETQPQLQGDVEIDAEAMRQQMFDYMNSLQRYLTLTGMSAKTLAPSVSDPASQINVQIEAICIELGIPVRIFKGSERGELASSQDAAAWFDRLKDRQRMVVTPRIVVPFTNRLIQVGALPMPERFVTRWPDLAALSEEEQARVGTLIVDVMTKYIQGGLEALMTPMDFMMRILHFSQDEAEGILEAAIEATESQQTLTTPPAGGQPPLGPDGQPLPVGSDGQPLNPDGSPAELGPDGQPVPPTDEEGNPVGPDGEPMDEEEQAAAEELAGLQAELAKLEGGGGKPPLKPQVKKKKPVPGFAKNAFCPTGDGGGQDNSCSPGQGGGGPTDAQRISAAVMLMKSKTTTTGEKGTVHEEKRHELSLKDKAVGTVVERRVAKNVNQGGGYEKVMTAVYKDGTVLREVKSLAEGKEALAKHRLQKLKEKKVDNTFSDAARKAAIEARRRKSAGATRRQQTQQRIGLLKGAKAHRQQEAKAKMDAFKQSHSQPSAKAAEIQKKIAELKAKKAASRTQAKEDMEEYKRSSEEQTTNDGEWITVKGTHVMVGEGGGVTKGPKALKSALGKGGKSKQDEDEESKKKGFKDKADEDAFEKASARQDRKEARMDAKDAAKSKPASEKKKAPKEEENPHLKEMRDQIQAAKARVDALKEGLIKQQTQKGVRPTAPEPSSTSKLTPAGLGRVVGSHIKAGATKAAAMAKALPGLIGTKLLGKDDFEAIKGIPQDLKDRFRNLFKKGKFTANEAVVLDPITFNALCELGLIYNAFCPTGPGGGQDNSCSPKVGGVVSGLAKTGRDSGKKLQSGDKITFTDGEYKGATATVLSQIPFQSKGSDKGDVVYRLDVEFPNGTKFNNTTQSAKQIEGKATYNAFCPTGPGGGQDNSCPPNRGGGAGKASAIAKEPKTAPPPGNPYNPNVEETDEHGVTKAARVGVDAMSLPPPPSIGQLPNLTPLEREVETHFREAYESDPDGVADKFRELVRASTKPGDPPQFGTDDAKALTDVWSHNDIEQRAEYRASLNTPLHQTANAIAKRAFVRELDNLSPGDQILVTVGGCGAGKGFALKKVPEALELKQQSKIVWDSAGDQNATENPWIQKEAEARGLKVNYVYVHADPYKAWADPERGAIQRAKDPGDGRMVDAKVFADSYAIGIKNHAAFYEKYKDSDNAKFVFLDNRSKPTLIDRIPEEGLSLDRHDLAKFAVEAVHKSDAPPRVVRGATIGQRIWTGENI